VLGGAESFIVTGAFTWGLALVGPQKTGEIMAWVGTAMYAAFGVGAPTGTTLYAGYGLRRLHSQRHYLIDDRSLPSLFSARTRQGAHDRERSPDGDARCFGASIVQALVTT
jgi:hypothetical protein